MRDPFSFFDDGTNSEFYGDLEGSRHEHKFALRLKVIETGRNVCFGGKGGGSAPKPDPQIGEAALMNAQTGEQWLNFAREQFAQGNIRQEQLDALSERIINQQLESNERANQWAAEDRQIQADYRDKYDTWADEDRAVGREYMDLFSGLGDEALAKGKEYEGIFRGIGSDSLAQGERYRDIFDTQANKQYQFGDDQLGRYRDTFAPIEDEFARKARDWDSQSRLEKVAAEAKGDVVSNAQAQQQAQARSMQAMGIDPRSGKYQAIDRETGLQTALASAAAQNQARDTARGQAMALQGQAIGIGQNVAGMGQQANQIGLGASQAAHGAYNAGQSLNMQAQSAAHTAYNTGMQTKLQAENLGLAAAGIGNTAASLGMGNQGAGYQGLGLGINAGSAAMGNALGAEGNWRGNVGIMGQGYQGQMQGYSNQANILNQQYQNQLAAWSAQQQANATSSAGLFGALGTGIGAYAALSSEDSKTNKKPVKGALAAIKGLPVEAWEYKDGAKKSVPADVIPPDDKRHIGTYAEDFARETGLGDGQTIPLQDAIGVTMKAVQELDDKVEAIAEKTPAKKTRAKRRAA